MNGDNLMWSNYVWRHILLFPTAEKVPEVTANNGEKEKSLPLPHRALSQGVLTAVCAVMCVQPTILAPAKGFSPWARFLSEIRADMSVKGTEGF